MFPNLQALLAMHQQYHGFGGPMPHYQPFQPGSGLFNSLPSIIQRPQFDGNPGMIPQPGIPQQPVATPQPVTPGGGYNTLPAQRPALQPQQIQGISQRMGMPSAY
jgi:hypothetical protein